MKNILIINHSVKNCGVYQYGKRVSDICKKSEIFNFHYAEVNSSEELYLQIKNINPSVLIYNYVPSTMPWMNFDVLSHIKNMMIKQGTIIHNQEFFGFDFYIHQNPYYEDNEYNFSLPRPLFNYNCNFFPTESDTLHIGTFGFSGKYKFVDEICRVVSEEFVSKKVQLNLHITKGFYSSDVFDEVKNDCIKILNKKNIKLNITNNFLTDEQILNFLHSNDLNIFFYENYSFYNGISSTIDYALSVKKPIAICKSNMFSHIIDIEPSICVEDNDLSDIINNGFFPLEEKYKSWSHEKLISKMENIIFKIMG